MEVSAGDSRIDALAVDNVQEADVAKNISWDGGDNIEDGVELDEVEQEHDQGEEPPEGGQEPRRRRLQGERNMESKKGNSSKCRLRNVGC